MTSAFCACLPALADSVLAPSIAEGTPPLVALTPAIEDVLRQRGDDVGYAIGDLQGHVVAGDTWIRFDVPSTPLAEFHSQEHDGLTYRVAVMRAETYGAGEMVLVLADGGDVRQQWVRQLLLHVLLPSVLLIAGAGIAIYWSVSRAFRPLLTLTQAVERRSPRDLSPISEHSSPAEVRPLVRSLNRLFALVNAQAEGQRRFVADAAHQLRTPLAALQAQVEAWALSAQAAQAEARRKGTEAQVVLSVTQIEQLRDATRRTSQLARQLLALSRADARNAEVQPLQKVDLKDLCESMLEMFFDQASAKGWTSALTLLRPVSGATAGCCANWFPTSWTTPSSTRRPAAASRCAAACTMARHSLRMSRKAGPSWRSRTTAPACPRPSARRSRSAFTARRARPVTAPGWGWPLPKKSPCCTRALWPLAPQRKARACWYAWSFHCKCRPCSRKQ